MPDSRELQDTNISSLTALGQISSSSLRLLLDISPDALVVVNTWGTIIMANQQSEAIFGYTREELQGMPLELLLPGRLRALHVTHREDYFAAPRMRPMGAGLDLTAQRKDGTEVQVEISLSPLQLDGAPAATAAIRDVTQQRVAERERLQQLKHIRLQSELIDQAHDAILVCDPISRVLSWNQGAEELYGWTAQEALGRVTHTLLKTRFPISLAAVDASLEKEGRWEGELTHIRSDGTPVIVESRQVLVRDEAGQPLAILELNRNITERRRFEQAERAVHVETVELLAFLQQVLDALPSSAYLVSGPDARLLLANRAAGRVWGASWQVNQPMLEFLSSNDIEILDAQGHPLSPDMFATLRAVWWGETVLHHQETIRYQDGSSLPVLVNAVALTSRQDFHAPQGEAEPLALVVHQDVSALKEAEYLKDEFVGIAAHELRTPLAVLAGYADMLLTQTARGHGAPLAEWQQEALEEIKQATGRLTSLTEDLLDMTRLQAGRLLLQRAPTNVVPLVRRVAAQLQRTTTRHQVEVRTAHSSLVADIDARRMEQVVTNLIENAIKYSPQGGPVFVSIWEEGDSRAACISVQDRGIGIPTQQQAQIFGRFMRAENAQAWGISGTGLGLYLCRELVERQGGQLWFESEEAVGTTFYVTFSAASLPDSRQ